MVIILPHEISTFCSLESVPLVLGKFLQHRHNSSVNAERWCVVCGIAMSSFSATCDRSKINEVLNGASYSLGCKFLNDSLSRIINN